MTDLGIKAVNVDVWDLRYGLFSLGVERVRATRFCVRRFAS